jgi:hypothetical protein
MASSGMVRHVALVRADVSEELSTSFIRMTRIGQLGTTLAVTSNRRSICKIRGFHGDEYKEWCLLGCYAVWLL